MVQNLETTSISVVIASKGRAEALSETIESLHRQTVTPKQIIVVVPSHEDLPRNQWGDGVQFIVGPHGSSSQRNKGIEAVLDTINYVGFFDDDFELSADYLAHALTFLMRIPRSSAYRVACSRTAA